MIKHVLIQQIVPWQFTDNSVWPPYQLNSSPLVTAQVLKLSKGVVNASYKLELQISVDIKTLTILKIQLIFPLSDNVQLCRRD